MAATGRGAGGANSRCSASSARAGTIELAAMDAVGDEQGVEPGRGGAGEIGAQRVADRQRPRRRDRRAAQRRDPLQRRRVDRPMRLAGVDRLAAERLVELGERAGAIDELVAAMDDEIGIGADHRQPALDECRESVGVILRRLGRVVEQAGAEQVGRRFRPDHGRRDAAARLDRRDQRQIARRADMVERRAAARGDHADRNVAGGDDRVESVGRDAEGERLVADDRIGARRVGDQDDRPAAAAKGGERLGRGAEGVAAVVQHAPDVAQDRVVAARQGAEPVDQRDGVGGDVGSHGGSG